MSGHLWKHTLFTVLEMPFLSPASPHSALPELPVLARVHPNISPGLALNSSCWHDPRGGLSSPLDCELPGGYL